MIALWLFVALVAVTVGVSLDSWLVTLAGVGAAWVAVLWEGE